MWYQRESLSGSDHQNQAIHVRSEVKSPFWKFWSEQILRLSLLGQTSILSRKRSWTWKWDLLSFFLIFDGDSQYAIHGFFPSASRRWCLDRDFSKVRNNMDTGFSFFIQMVNWYHPTLQSQEITWLVMNKADTTTAKAKDLTERSPYLWHTVPMFWKKEGQEDGAANPFLPDDCNADNEDDLVGTNFLLF